MCKHQERFTFIACGITKSLSCYLNFLLLLFDFLWTGRGGHSHKFEKIKHILEFYPNLKYVLIGDDSQHDPNLYEAIAKIFPLTVKAVYIRQTGRSRKKKVTSTLENVSSLGVEVCYFKNSSEAILHSKKIGLIDNQIDFEI